LVLHWGGKLNTHDANMVKCDHMGSLRAQE
jgi:hypothetical protein